MSEQPVHRDVHFWSEQLSEPPCGTLEDRFDWSDALEDVTCAACLETLRESDDVAGRDEDALPDEDQPAAP